MGFEEFEDRYVYNNKNMCVHQMPPEWCATCGEAARKRKKNEEDRELFNLLNTEGWSL